MTPREIRNRLERLEHEARSDPVAADVRTLRVFLDAPGDGRVALVALPPGGLRDDLLAMYGSEPGRPGPEGGRG